MSLARSTYYVSVSTGMAMASGCFFVAASLTSELHGRQLVLAIAVGMALCLNAAHSIGCMARRFPGAAGIRTYIKHGLSDRISIFAVYLLFVTIALFIALECQVLGDALSSYFGTPLRHVTFLAVVPLTMAVNLAGLSLPRAAQVVTTIVLVVGVLGLGAFALAATPADATPVVVAPPSVESALAAVGLSFFLFMGFEWMVTSILHRDDCNGRLQRGMLASLVLLAVMFALFAYAVDRAALASPAAVPPQFALAGIAFGRFGREEALLITVLATLTTLNAGFIGTARLLYGLAREGVLPPWLARTGRATMVPYAAVLAVGVLGVAASSVLAIVDLRDASAAICAFVYACLYALFVLSELKLRERSSAPAGAAYKVAKYATAALFVVFGAGALATSDGALRMVVAAVVLVACWRWAGTSVAARAIARETVGVAR